MPAMSRVFTIPASPDQDFTITLHEPSLTADNLGMKTWVSSYLLSRRLHRIFGLAPQLVSSAVGSAEDKTHGKKKKNNNNDARMPARTLELGSGTGLVGLSFAALQGSHASIHLTDLPAIVENLAHNVSLNAELLDQVSARVTTGVLDWSVDPETPLAEGEQYDTILTADSLYSPNHPKWLVDTIFRWLSRRLNARVVVEIPLRDAYQPQVQEFRKRMGLGGMVVEEEGEEVGYDDWESADGSAVEVRCWWSIWRWSGN